MSYFINDFAVFFNAFGANAVAELGFGII